MQQRFLGCHGPLGLAPGPGHDDLGPRHRRARGARAAGRLRRGRRHARRHRRGLHRRRLRAADRLPARRRVRPRRDRARHQGRRRAPRGERFTNASRGHLVSSLDASLERLGVDHVDLWQVHTWVDDAPLEETLSRPGLRRDAAGGRRTSASATTTAGSPRRPPPGSAPCRAGPRWPPTRWSTPCSTGPSRPRSSRPRRRSASASCRGRRWAAAC